MLTQTKEFCFLCVIVCVFVYLHVCVCVCVCVRVCVRVHVRVRVRMRVWVWKTLYERVVDGSVLGVVVRVFLLSGYFSCFIRTHISPTNITDGGLDDKHWLDV